MPDVPAPPAPRVALVTYSTKPRGGVVHTLALAEALARAGTPVTVWTLGRGGDAGFFRPVDPAVELAVVPFPDRDGEGVADRVVRSIATLAAAFRPRAAAYAIVHAQDCISASAVLDAGVREVVRTVHHLDRFTTPVLAACHERALVTPVAHVCVSAAVAAEVRAGWGITATVIPNGVDAARFAAAAAGTERAARAAWRDRFGPYVLAVGGIEPRKGTLDLVDAMAMLPRSPEGSPVPLVIAGGETLFDYRGYRAEVDARAAALGVEPFVLGPVDHDALPSLVAAAGAFAFPSTKEGFGLAAMEALAAGVPLITRDLPVLREVFGDAALFAADPAGFAAQLAAALAGPPDPARRAAGIALAHGHSWDAAAAAHRILYARLLDGNSGHGNKVRLA